MPLTAELREQFAAQAASFSNAAQALSVLRDDLAENGVDPKSPNLMIDSLNTSTQIIEDALEQDELSDAMAQCLRDEHAVRAQTMIDMGLE